MDRRRFLQAGASLGTISVLRSSAEPIAAESPKPGDREYWISLLTRISDPVLVALRERKLKQVMPVEAPHGNGDERRQYTHLEALGRLLAGIAPWLESGSTTGEEGALRGKYAELAREAMDAGTDPASPDFMNFSEGRQPVVDAAFLALAIVRAPHELWKKLDPKAQKNTIAALVSSRKILPPYNNWLLFPAMVEAALLRVGGAAADWDAVRIDYALRTINTWYKGDGVYGDGPEFHWDYYNSYVIHPMLLNILEAGRMAVPLFTKAVPYWSSMEQEMTRRAQRYAAIQERIIGPDGSFSPIGRSLCYRFGAFHLLAEVALRKMLPEGVSPAQVRSGLTAVMRRMAEAPGTFDGNGWLRVGFVGHQPEMAEPYISTGSCYLCSAAWLPLGLPAADAFWADAARPWTSKKAWSGENVPADHAMQEGSRE
jgi:hypothetical protein